MVYTLTRPVPTWISRTSMGSAAAWQVAPIYGLATPGQGIKVGFSGVGPQVDPDHRDFAAEPTQLAALREYARRWLPGVDPDVVAPISCK